MTATSPNTEPRSDAATAGAWLALLLPVAPLAWAGATALLRGQLKLPLVAAAGLALVLSLGAAFLALRLEGARAPSSGSLPLGLGLSAGLGVFSGALLWVGEFDGLPSVGGGDAGQHVGLRALFLSSQPDAYYGFAGFYVVTAALERLVGLTPFESFRAVFYAVPFLLALCCAAVAVAAGALGAGASRARAGFLAACLTAVFFYVALPLLSYAQADGFFPHLASLPLWTLAWAVVSSARHSAVRLGVAVLFPALLRASYGLNLPEVLLVGAGLVAWESRAVVGPRRWGLVAVAVAMTLGAAAAARQLWPLIVEMPGGVVAHRVELVAVAQLGLGALLLGTHRWAPHASKGVVSGARFMGALCCAGGAVPLAIALAGLPRHYYLYKYGLAGLVGGALAFGTTVGVTASRSWRWGAALLVGAALVFASTRGNGKHWKLFLERVQGRPPFARLGPLGDRQAEAQVRAVLSARGADFGGLLSSSWPGAMFLNATFGFWEDWPQYAEARLREGPGRCVFWYRQPDLFEGFGANVAPAALGEAVARLEAKGDSQCAQWPARGRAGMHDFCWRCDGALPP